MDICPCIKYDGGVRTLEFQITECSESMVQGLTRFGKFCVKWEGDSPKVNTSYNVELDIAEILMWGQDIALSNREDNHISHIDGITSRSGVLESVDDDGYSVLRMGAHVIPFSSQGNAFEIGSKITLSVKSISAHPFHI